MVKTKIIYDYSKLCGKIREVFGTQSNFAKEVPMNEATLCNKLASKVDFSQKEMNRTCDLLHEPYSMIPIYFFTHKVQEIEQK